MTVLQSLKAVIFHISFFSEKARIDQIARQANRKRLFANIDRPLVQFLSARYRCGRSGVQILGASNRYSVAYGSPLRRFFEAV